MKFKRFLLRFLAAKVREKMVEKRRKKIRKVYDRKDPHSSALAEYIRDFSIGGRYYACPLDSRDHKLIRRRCSLPYAMFATLCERIRTEKWEIPHIHHVINYSTFNFTLRDFLFLSDLLGDV